MGRKKKQLMAMQAPDPASIAGQTPFRAVERKYKQRYSPLDLAEVFDWTQWDPNEDEGDVDWSAPPDVPEGRPPCAVAVETESSVRDLLAAEFPDLDLHSDGARPPVIAFPGFPGFLYLPAALPPAVQRHLARRSLTAYTAPPNQCDMSAHWAIPASGLWPLHAAGSTDEIPLRPPPADGDDSDEDASGAYARGTPPTHLTPLPAGALLDRLRWCTLGYQYHWASKTYRSTEMFPFPADLAGLARAVATAVESATYRGIEVGTRYPGTQYVAQAGVLNVYGYRDALMGHVDESEPNRDAPLVSVSLGASAIFVVGGKTRATRPMALRLRSGDAVVMSGAARRAFHGIPRVLEDEYPDWMAETEEQSADAEWSMVVKYLRARKARINLNVRQVF
ncbi:hypothetical protein H9P43_008612 [Blastocladiella emersonii ATCC 22665]|nr:hypothetical protein H9P43_008569 [Blastocladiella emersonii ATCC 22665]KAI9159272.1 hypothetical protein H9P43_008612 [Blastocladiella emersonii ATCC 22665]